MRYNQKLNADRVREIRLLSRAGYFKVSIAALYGVTPSLICAVVLGRQWAHIPDLPNQRVPAIARARILRHTKTNSTLTPTEVNEVRQLAKARFTQRSIADKYGLTQSVVAELLGGSIYSHVPVVTVPLPDTRHLKVRYRTRASGPDKTSGGTGKGEESLPPTTPRPVRSVPFSPSGFRGRGRSDYGQRPSTAETPERTAAITRVGATDER